MVIATVLMKKTVLVLKMVCLEIELRMTVTQILAMLSARALRRVCSEVLFVV